MNDVDREARHDWLNERELADERPTKDEIEREERG